MPSIKTAGTRPLVAITLLAAIALSGCNEYGDRRENVSVAAGDSITRNKAIHIIDPWPSASFDTRIPVNGARAQRAIESYRAGASTRGGVRGAPVNIAPTQTGGATR